MLPGREAEVKKNAFDFADIPAGSRMLIATPLIVDAYIRKIPKGHFTGIRQMRKDLAAEFKRMKNNGVEHKWLTGKRIRV